VEPVSVLDAQAPCRELMGSALCLLERVFVVGCGDAQRVSCC
jgi:hypothetical protein